MERMRHEPVRVVTLDEHVVTLLPRAGYEAGYVPERGVVGFAFDAQHGVHAFGGDRPLPFQAWPDTLSWVPGGCDVRSRSPRGGEYLTVASTTDVGAEDRSPRAHAARRARRFNDGRDGRARRAAHAIRARLLRGDGDRWAIEEEVLVLHERVDALFDGGDERRCVGRGALTPARLRRVDEWIEAHLGERAGVAALASELGLSAGFLTRAMKAATGRSPHEHVLERRVTRARALLHGTGRTVADIALDCGFSSHSHLGATLKARLGVTPRELRGDASARRRR